MAWITSLHCRMSLTVMASLTVPTVRASAVAPRLSLRSHSGRAWQASAGTVRCFASKPRPQVVSPYRPIRATASSAWTLGALLPGSSADTCQIPRLQAAERQQAPRLGPAMLAAMVALSSSISAIDLAFAPVARADEEAS